MISIDAYTVRASRVIAETPGAIWDAFRDPGRLARWWGPAGFTNEFESFDFRPCSDRRRREVRSLVPSRMRAKQIAIARGLRPARGWC